MEYNSGQYKLDNSLLNNLDNYANQEGGKTVRETLTRYNNVYDLIKDTFRDDIKTGNYEYSEKTQSRNCQGAQLTLRCDSGKILKYFIRAEMITYKRELNNRINKEIGTIRSALTFKRFLDSNPKVIEIKKELKQKYMRIIRKYDTKDSQTKRELGTVNSRIQSLEQEKASIEATLQPAVSQPISDPRLGTKGQPSQTKAFQKSNKSFIESQQKRLLAINKQIAEIYKQRGKVEASEQYNYKVDIYYLKRYFSQIRQLLGNLAKNLEQCNYIETIDKKSIGLIIIKDISEDLYNQIKAQRKEENKSRLTKIWEKIKPSKKLVKGAGIMLGIGAIATIAFQATAAAAVGVAGLTVVGKAGIYLGPAIVVGLIAGYAIYKYMKKRNKNLFGEKVVDRLEFIDNLKTFCINENSVLHTLEKDLIDYLRSVNKITGDKDLCNTESEVCVIDVKSLCFKSVAKDCPDEQTGLQVSQEQLAIQDKRKQITRGMFEYMQEAFEEMANIADDTENPLNNLTNQELQATLSGNVQEPVAPGNEDNEE